MMREYSFVRTGRGIYRVFGNRHPASGIRLLLRYFHTPGDGWRKPPVFAAEVPSGPVLDHYDLDSLIGTESGITVGLGPPDPAAYAEVYDPLGHHAAGVIEELPLPREATAGLTGSRLVGLERPESDVDLVFYGPDGPRWGRTLLDDRQRPEDLAEISTTVRRLLDLNRDVVPRLPIRNIYKGRIVFRGVHAKVDLTYAASARAIDSGVGVTAARYEAGSRTVTLAVTDAGGRHLFPGFLTCRTPRGDQVTLWVRDHVLSLLLPGDRFTVQGRCREDRRNVMVGDRVVALEAR